jgi:Fe-S-cluster containining protein
MKNYNWLIIAGRGMSVFTPQKGDHFVEPDLTPILPHETFCFSCTPDVPCFNDCCRDLNQFLTPYDVLRLTNHLGLSSGQFLDKYTSRHTGPESGLPIVTLRLDDPNEPACPFVSQKGCTVYESRPSSCRTYPLLRAVRRSRRTGIMTEQFMVLKEPHCRGFQQGKTQSVRQWIDAQKVTLYNEINDKLLDIISLKNRLMPGPLDSKSRRLFHTALYDLDNFRSQIADDGLLDNFRTGSRLMNAALDDDVALLELGMNWIKHALFGQN